MGICEIILKESSSTSNIILIASLSGGLICLYVKKLNHFSCEKNLKIWF